MKYNPKVAIAFFKEHGLPEPETEYKFCDTRRWKFDFAFRCDFSRRHEIALEVEGAVWTHGRHTRGSGFVKDMEKYNEAAAMGWLVLRCQPRDLTTLDTVNLLKRALGIQPPHKPTHD